MNLSNKRRQRWVTILIAVGLLLVLPASVLIYQRVVSLRSGAASDRPKDVVISNVTAEAAVISWISNPNPVVGSVKYSLNENELNTASSRLAQDGRDIKQGGSAKARLTHYATLTNLLPGKTYYFRLVSGNATFPATNQSPLQFSTLGSGIAKVGSPITAYGEVSNSDDPSKNTIIYATLENDGQKSTTVSTVVTDTRTWFIDLTNALDTDRTAYFTVNDKTKISILGQAGTKGIKVETNVEFIKTNSLVLNLEDNYPVAQYLPDGSVFPDPGTGTSGTPTGSSTPTRDPSQPYPKDAPLEAARLVSVTSEQVDLPIPFDKPVISNLADSSVTVVLAAKKPFSTKVCSSDLCFRDDSADPGEAPKSLLHHITLKDLTPAQQYALSIENFAQTETSVSTVATSESPPASLNISGYLTSGKGKCVVIVLLQRGSETSGLVTRLADADMNWQANVGAVRQSSGGALFQPQDSDTLIAQAQCMAGSEVLTGKAQTTVGQGQTDKITMKMESALDSDFVKTGNNIYSMDILDGDFGVGGVLPDASESSEVVVWMVSLGLICLAVGGGLIGLYLQRSKKNQWEEELLRDAQLTS